MNGRGIEVSGTPDMKDWFVRGLLAGTILIGSG